jgi:hypothetical protein
MDNSHCEACSFAIWLRRPAGRQNVLLHGLRLQLANAIFDHRVGSEAILFAPCAQRRDVARNKDEGNDSHKNRHNANLCKET